MNSNTICQNLEKKICFNILKKSQKRKKIEKKEIKIHYRKNICASQTQLSQKISNQIYEKDSVYDFLPIFDAMIIKFCFFLFWQKKFKEKNITMKFLKNNIISNNFFYQSFHYRISSIIIIITILSCKANRL